MLTALAIQDAKPRDNLRAYRREILAV